MSDIKSKPILLITEPGGGIALASNFKDLELKSNNDTLDGVDFLEVDFESIENGPDIFKKLAGERLSSFNKSLSNNNKSMLILDARIQSDIKPVLDFAMQKVNNGLTNEDNVLVVMVRNSYVSSATPESLLEFDVFMHDGLREVAKPISESASLEDRFKNRLRNKLVLKDNSESQPSKSKLV